MLWLKTYRPECFDASVINENILKTGNDVGDAVKLLTHDKDISYDDYIKSIKESNNKLAIEVKGADLTINMDLSRIENQTQKDIDRLNNKYKPALDIISDSNKKESQIEIRKVSITSMQRLHK